MEKKIANLNPAKFISSKPRKYYEATYSIHKEKTSLAFISTMRICICGNKNKEGYLKQIKTTAAPNEAVPQRNIAGWQRSSCSDEVAGKFVTAGGFVLVLTMIPSNSSMAW